MGKVILVVFILKEFLGFFILDGKIWGLGILLRVFEVVVEKCFFLR